MRVCVFVCVFDARCTAANVVAACSLDVVTLPLFSCPYCVAANAEWRAGVQTAVEAASIGVWFVHELDASGAVLEDWDQTWGKFRPAVSSLSSWRVRQCACVSVCGSS